MVGDWLKWIKMTLTPHPNPEVTVTKYHKPCNLKQKKIFYAFDG